MIDKTVDTTLLSHPIPGSHRFFTIFDKELLESLRRRKRQSIPFRNYYHQFLYTFFSPSNGRSEQSYILIYAALHDLVGMMATQEN